MVYINHRFLNYLLAKSEPEALLVSSRATFLERSMPLSQSHVCLVKRTRYEMFTTRVCSEQNTLNNNNHRFLNYLLAKSEPEALLVCSRATFLEHSMPLSQSHVCAVKRARYTIFTTRVFRQKDTLHNINHRFLNYLLAKSEPEALLVRPLLIATQHPRLKFSVFDQRRWHYGRAFST